METVCGAVMCKDEAAVIERCLLSMMPMVDTILVADTGSTDATLSVVAATLGDFPHIVVHVPFEGFGKTRSEVVRQAALLGDWVLMIDADCTVRGTFTPPSAGEGDLGLIQFLCDGIVSRRAVFLRSSIPWRYEEVEVHEYATSDEPHTAVKLDGVYMEHHGPAGDRRSPESDLAAIERLQRKHPDDARWVFYRAQTLKALKRWDESVREYRRAASMGEPSDEWVWYSMYQAAVIAEDAEALLAAWKVRPHRAETPYALAQLFRKQGRCIQAVLAANAAAELPEPADSMFVNRPVYLWGALLECSLALATVGQFGEAREVNATILAKADIPTEVRDQIAEFEESYPGAPV